MPADPPAPSEHTSTLGDWLFLVVFGIIGMACGFGGAYSLYVDFLDLESGKVESIRVASHIAWVYNLGPPWSERAKWIEILSIGGVGVITLGLVLMGIRNRLRAKV